MFFFFLLITEKFIENAITLVKYFSTIDYTISQLSRNWYINFNFIEN